MLLGTKLCTYCQVDVEIKITRDISRKKFCSRSCSSKYHIENKNIGMIGKKHTDESKSKIGKKASDRGCFKGAKNPNYKGVIYTGIKCSEKNKIKSSKRMKNGGAAKARKAQGGKKSSLEIKMENFLKEIGIEYTAQKIINNHAVDFYIDKFNLIVECDGNYWHGLENQKVRDQTFNEHCITNGYNMLRFTETEIKNESFKNIMEGWICLAKTN